MTTAAETGFDPSAHLTSVSGAQYLGARQRLRWLRSEHPDWTVNTGIIELDFQAGYAVVFAEILDETGRLIARAMKQEERKDFRDFVEKAETGAIGRACAIAGYGTEDAVDLDEGTVSDSPVSGGGRGPSSPARPSARPAVVSQNYSRGVLDDVPNASEMTGVPEEPADLFAAREEFAPIQVASPGDTCEEHGTPWGGTPGDLWHGPKGIVEGGYCRHPGNTKKTARRA